MMPRIYDFCERGSITLMLRLKCSPSLPYVHAFVFQEALIPVGMACRGRNRKTDVIRYTRRDRKSESVVRFTWDNCSLLTTADAGYIIAIARVDRAVLLSAIAISQRRM